MGCGCAGSTHPRQQNLSVREGQEAPDAGGTPERSVAGPGFGQGYFWNGPKKTADPDPPAEPA